MFNLLPQEYKKKILKEYLFRRVILIVSLTIIIGVLAIIVLIPIYISGQIETSQLQAHINTLNVTSNNTNTQKVSAETAAVRSKLSLLGSAESNVLMSDVLTDTMKEAGPDIVLNSFIYQRGTGSNKSKLTLSGIALNRDALQGYGKRLKSESVFNPVNVPIENFAQARNIKFTISVEGTF